jgi:hypothetical protein
MFMYRRASTTGMSNDEKHEMNRGVDEREIEERPVGETKRRIKAEVCFGRHCTA